MSEPPPSHNEPGLGVHGWYSKPEAWVGRAQRFAWKHSRFRFAEQWLRKASGLGTRILGARLETITGRFSDRLLMEPGEEILLPKIWLGHRTARVTSGPARGHGLLPRAARPATARLEGGRAPPTPAEILLPSQFGDLLSQLRRTGWTRRLAPGHTADKLDGWLVALRGSSESRVATHRNCSRSLRSPSDRL